MDMQDFQAVPPCYGVDLGRLRRHAEQARTLVGARDLKIFGCWLVVLVTMLTTLPSGRRQWTVGLPEGVAPTEYRCWAGSEMSRS